MTAPDAIQELVAKFDQHRKEYQTHKNETELRREFLDPFFDALGWDVFNKKSYSERFKEVQHEASVEVEGKAKVADYAFRAGDKIMFFVEAKKPSVNIGENPEPAFPIAAIWLVCQAGNQHPDGFRAVCGRDKRQEGHRAG